MSFNLHLAVFKARRCLERQTKAQSESEPESESETESYDYMAKRAQYDIYLYLNAV